MQALLLTCTYSQYINLLEHNKIFYCFLCDIMTNHKWNGLHLFLLYIILYTLCGKTYHLYMSMYISCHLQVMGVGETDFVIWHICKILLSHDLTFDTKFFWCVPVWSTFLVVYVCTNTGALKALKQSHHVFHRVLGTILYLKFYSYKLEMNIWS